MTPVFSFQTLYFSACLKVITTVLKTDVTMFIITWDGQFKPQTKDCAQHMPQVGRWRKYNQEPNWSDPIIDHAYPG